MTITLKHWHIENYWFTQVSFVWCFDLNSWPILPPARQNSTVATFIISWRILEPLKNFHHFKLRQAIQPYWINPALLAGRNNNTLDWAFGGVFWQWWFGIHHRCLGLWQWCGFLCVESLLSDGWLHFLCFFCGLVNRLVCLWMFWGALWSCSESLNTSPQLALLSTWYPVGNLRHSKLLIVQYLVPCTWYGYKVMNCRHATWLMHSPTYIIISWKDDWQM